MNFKLACAIVANRPICKFKQQQFFVRKTGALFNLID